MCSIYWNTTGIGFVFFGGDLGLKTAAIDVSEKSLFLLVSCLTASVIFNALMEIFFPEDVPSTTSWEVPLYLRFDGVTVKILGL